MARTNDQHAQRLREKLNHAHEQLDAARDRGRAILAELKPQLEDLQQRWERVQSLAKELEELVAVARKIKVPS